MKFEITLGELIQSLTFIACALALYIRISDKLKSLEVKVDVIWEAWLNQKHMAKIE